MEVMAVQEEEVVQEEVLYQAELELLDKVIMVVELLVLLAEAEAEVLQQ
jgi:hypothetical protein